MYIITDYIWKFYILSKKNFLQNYAIFNAKLEQSHKNKKTLEKYPKTCDNGIYNGYKYTLILYNKFWVL